MVEYKLEDSLVEKLRFGIDSSDLTPILTCIHMDLCIIKIKGSCYKIEKINSNKIFNAIVFQ